MQDIITPMTRHCRELMRWEGMHLFQGRRRLLAKMETTLKNNSTFRNVIVNFSENLMYLTSR